MKLYFAPLQGYTDHLYRSIHSRVAGGIDTYLSPFLRCDGGKVRNKDLRDIAPENNEGLDLVPQVIAADTDELAPLLDIVEQAGYNRVDLNLGCPFPLQTGRGRGAAALTHPDRIERMMQELQRRTRLKISVKMRSGLTDHSEGLAAIEVLNHFKLEHIAIHPRLGVQQYKGLPDCEAFRRLKEASHHPTVYNGDIASLEDIDEIVRLFPDLSGIMIGRGLLARPTLAREWRDGRPLDNTERLAASLEMHRRLYDAASQKLQGDQQILARMQAFWEYQKPLIDKKVYKRLMKTTSLRNYEEAVRSLE